MNSKGKKVLTAEVYSRGYVDVTTSTETKVVKLMDFLENLENLFMAKSGNSTRNITSYPEGLMFLEQTSSTSVTIALNYKEFWQTCMYQKRNETNTWTAEMCFPEMLVVIQATVDKGNLIFDQNNIKWYNITEREVRSFIKRVADIDRFLNSGIIPSMLPNMYGSGAMCLGGNPLPKTVSMSDLSGLSFFKSVLHSSPFNNDLSVSHVNSDMVVTLFDSFKNREGSNPVKDAEAHCAREGTSMTDALRCLSVYSCFDGFPYHLSSVMSERDMGKRKAQPRF